MCLLPKLGHFTAEEWVGVEAGGNCRPHVEVAKRDQMSQHQLCDAGACGASGHRVHRAGGGGRPPGAHRLQHQQLRQPPVPGAPGRPRRYLHARLQGV